MIRLLEDIIGLLEAAVSRDWELFDHELVLLEKVRELINEILER